MRLESRIPGKHPLRLIRSVADEALKALDAPFAALYSENSRPSASGNGPTIADGLTSPFMENLAVPGRPTPHAR